MTRLIDGNPNGILVSKGWRAVLYIVIGRFRRGFLRGGNRPATVPTGEPAESTATDGLKFLGSWVEAGLRRCFQVIECDELAALQRWAAQWRHCVDFEVIPIVPSAEAVSTLQPLLDGATAL